MVSAPSRVIDSLAIATSLSAEFAETAGDRDAKGGSPTKELNRLRESGLLKLHIPEEFGGWGQDWITAHGAKSGARNCQSRWIFSAAFGLSLRQLGDAATRWHIRAKSRILHQPGEAQLVFRRFSKSARP